jgi:ABC-type nitrate/sulfonate/bicarbonate transport system substrate-binding protein
VAKIVLGIPEGTGRIYAGPTLVALGRGYFQEADLEIEVLESGGRRGSIPMLVAGELDISPQGPSLEFFRAWDPERPIIMAADHGSMRPGRGTGAIVARSDLMKSGTLRDYADLRGKRIGLSPLRGDHDWLTFATALRRGGLTFADVEVVTCDFGGGRHEALANGTIDLATVGRPSSITEGRDAGLFDVWKHEYEVRPGRQQRTVMFGHPFWSTRPDEARRYIAAYLRGARDYYGAFELGIDHEAVVDVLAREAGADRGMVANDMAPLGINPDGYLNVEDIAADLGWYQEQDLLDQNVSIDGVVNHRFLEAALAELGVYQPPASAPHGAHGGG